MKERPILFSGEMVRAILRDIDPKTMTRRVVKCPKGHPYPDEWQMHGNPVKCKEGWAWNLGGIDLDLKCPYGKVGDRLWVKKTCFPFAMGKNESLPEGAYFGQPIDVIEGKNIVVKSTGVFYAADGQKPELMGNRKWKPSIHMPRWASRITLEITNIRVERLHDITEEDAEKEGVPFDWDDGLPDRKWAPAWKAAGKIGRLTSFGLRSGFAVLWESIHGAGSWDKNDWVWVIEFKRVSE